MHVDFAADPFAADIVMHGTDQAAVHTDGLCMTDQRQEAPACQACGMQLVLTI